MRLRIAPTVCVILAACAAGPSWSTEPVTVANFPEVQRISGQVVVTEPIPQTRFESVKALVAPAAFSDAGQWTEAGVIDAKGFTHVTLSLAGSLQGSPQGGSVGVALVPGRPGAVERPADPRGRAVRPPRRGGGRRLPRAGSSARPPRPCGSVSPAIASSSTTPPPKTPKPWSTSTWAARSRYRVLL